MLYVVQLTEHDEETGMKWLHKAVMDDEILDFA